MKRDESDISSTARCVDVVGGNRGGEGVSHDEGREERCVGPMTV